MAYNYLDKTGLALVWEKIKNALAGKVDKVDGKGLSTNDYTSAEKTKLSGIASGAQVNVLEGIQKNGTNVTITNKIANISVPTKTSDITNDSGFITSSSLPTKVSDLTNDTGFQTASDVSTAISSALTTVMDYKGTVATVANLPASGNKNGDIYHVTADGGEYAWNGTTWEELGSEIDLSGYVEDTDMTAITSTEINTICV